MPVVVEISNGGGARLPLFIEFKMGQRKAPHPFVQEPLAGIAEIDQQIADRVAVNASDSLGGPDRHALRQQV